MTRSVYELLPHRPPFVWVDDILEIEAGVRCVAAKRVDPDDPVFAGHFPGNPLLPGVLVIEAAAQTAGLMLAAASPGGTGLMVLAAVEHFKFKRPVRPGDLMEIETRLLTEVAGMAAVSAFVRVETAVVASGQLSLAPW